MRAKLQLGAAIDYAFNCLEGCIDRATALRLPLLLDAANTQNDLGMRHLACL